MLIKEKDFQGFVQGNHGAFEIIFRQYYKTLVSFAMRYKIEGMEAEDLVIEMIYRIWMIRKDIKSPAALHCLFFTSVHNRALNVLRNSKKREQITSEYSSEREEQFYEYVMEEETGRVLDQAIEALPPQCRQVVLFLIEGKSTSEIADKMGISVNSVRTYKLRAIEILKVLLRNHPCLLWFFTFRIGD